MKLVTAAVMRELDHRAIEEFGTAGEELMERAAQGAADAVHRLLDQAGFTNPLVHVLAGRGNNGGDAFAVARILKEGDVAVEVWLAGAAADLKGDALKHFGPMKNAGVAFHELPTKDDWEDALADPLAADVLVDGVLGTGTGGPPRGPAAGAIRYLNAQARNALVVALDLPSGLHPDTGRPEGDTVRADLTVTMGLPKRGLVQPTALDYVGSLEVVDLGLSPDSVAEAPGDPDLELVYLTDLRDMFPRRRRDAHKGDFGRALLVGGARGYLGAIAMAARAAVRSGAGLVSAVVPESIALAVAGATLETMVQGAPETADGALAAAGAGDWLDRLDRCHAVLAGPGMTRGADTAALVAALLERSVVPLVADADAITVFAGRPEVFRKARGPLVLTPHPGELGVLLGVDADTIQRDRLGAARRAVEVTGATVVLKGAGTLVAAPGHPTGVNVSGNPGMATGGAGDVLAGLLTGLLAQGLAPYDAARAAVYLHGRAGDLAAWRKSQAGLNATDLIEELPFAFRDASVR